MKMKQHKTNRRSLRFVSTIALLWALIFTLTIFASAALSINVTGLQADPSTGQNSASWSVGDDGISIIGSAATESGSCGTTTQSGSLTLTSTKYDEAVLSFNYTVEKLGTLKIDGESITKAGSFSKTLKKNESVKIELASPSSVGTAKLTMTNIKLEKIVNLNVTFNPGVYYAQNEQGTVVTNTMTYDVNGKSVTTDNGGASFENVSNTDAYTLTPALENYHLLYAVDASGNYFYPNGDGNLVMGTENDVTLTPYFVYNTATKAPFRVGNALLWSWEAAVRAAGQGGTVIVNASHALPTDLLGNGLKENGSYVAVNQNGTLVYKVPQGVKFLVPRKDGDSGVFSAEIACQTSHVDRSVYVTLTVPSDIQLLVEGEMNVNALLRNAGANAPAL